MIAFIRRYFFEIFLFIICGIATGCTSIPAGHISSEEEEVENVHDGIAVAAQYRRPSEPGTFYMTAEIYLTNRGTNPISFSVVELNGEELLSMETAGKLAAEDAAKKGEKSSVNKPQDYIFGQGINWWQFYPCATAMPNATVMLQINFRKLITTAQTFTIHTTDGRLIRVGMPAFEMPEKAITAITYAVDYSQMYVQYISPRASVRRLWVNGEEIKRYKILRGLAREDACVLAFEPPVKLRTGMPVYVKVQFKDHTVSQALVRAFAGILIDAMMLPKEEESKLRKGLNLDADPAVVMILNTIGGDITCQDAFAKKNGFYAMPAVNDRIKSYNTFPDKLSAVHFCVAEFTAQWDLYAALTDTAFVHPFALSHYHDPAHFFEKEDIQFHNGYIAMRPRPFMWIPEAYREKERYIEPEELKVLLWTALVQGCKGVCYYGYRHLQDRGFKDNAQLMETIVSLNKEIRKQMRLLSPLICASTNTIGDKQKGVKLYTAWAGEHGMLIVLRNLDYITDDKSNEEGKKPRFKAVVKPCVDIQLILPSWFGKAAVKPMHGEGKVIARYKQRKVSLSIHKFGSYKVIWVKNYHSLLGRYFGWLLPG